MRLNSKVTDQLNIYEGNDPCALVEDYGSPLYVYNERIIRQNCRDLKSMISYKNFQINYSVKANSNLTLLKIVCQEGLDMDAMSPGEIYLGMKAGFDASRIFFVPNNVSADELRFAADRGILISADSLSQLRLIGEISPGSRVAVRFNPGVGVGHHAKVVTAGKDTKFGVNPEYIPQVKNIIAEYGLKLVGINQHVGSLFMEYDKFLESIENLLVIARSFEDLEFIDLGGGFGVPYRKQEGQPRLDLVTLGQRLSQYMEEFAKAYGKEITFKIEPGRYIPCEAGVLLGTVHAVKYNQSTKYIGTDIGQNVLARPVLYDAHHDIEVYRKGDKPSEKDEAVNVVGNICETGDVITKNRVLPEIFEGDILGILDAGSYGFSMSSVYNQRPRPAEVLIDTKGNPRVIRRRECLEDLLRHMDNLD